MSKPLVDVSANPRQPGFKPAKEGSRIPNPPKFRRTGSTGRHSPFSVSTTGSPRYTAFPASSSAVKSPTPASKLPRKSSPSQSAFSNSFTYGSGPSTPRSSLPRAQGVRKQSTTAAPLSSNSGKLDPVLSRNKPLPSPPIAQIIDPKSPPKAQRTLVDAEAGSPTEEQWPILRPENISPPKAHSTPTSSNLTQRCVSEGSALPRNGIPVLKSRATTSPYLDASRTSFQTGSSSTEDDDSCHKKFRQMIEPRTLNYTDQFAKSFHAFSTDTEVAVDTVLDYKHHGLPAAPIPPRVSSKRDSLPSPRSAQLHTIAQPSSQSVKPGSTTWPVLGAETEPVLEQQSTTTYPSGHTQHCEAELEHIQRVTPNPELVMQSKYGSIGSASTWSLDADSFLNEEPEETFEGTVRVKRLSSCNPDSGPVLRISADADAVLLGRHDSIPNVPALHEHVPDKVPQDQSMSTLAGHVSAQITRKMNSRTTSPSSTQSSAEGGVHTSTSIKIAPIRTMQLPRKPSPGDLSKESILPVVPILMEPDQNTNELAASCENLGDSSNASHETPSPKQKHVLEVQVTNGVSMNSYEHGNYCTTLSNDIPPKATQFLGTEIETSPPARRKLLPVLWKTPKFTAVPEKKAEISRSKDRSSLLSTARSSNRVSASVTHSPSAASSKLTQSSQSQAGVQLSGPSKSEAAELVSTPKRSVRNHIPSGNVHHLDKNAVSIGQEIKTKRSFRDIFQKREIKPTPQSAKISDSKRSSVAGSSLAQRFRNSTNFSKVKLPDARPGTGQSHMSPKSSRDTVDREDRRQSALSALKASSSEVPAESAAAGHDKTATVVHSIINRVTKMSTDSPGRLRGLEIAEAVLHAAECSKQAKLSAELARKHARDAELNGERAGIELQRLQKLCEPELDNETLEAIKQIIAATGLDQPPATACH